MKRLIRWILRTIPRPALQRVSHIGLRFLALFYRGKNVQCPVCERQFRKFLPYGRFETRDNALCPSCLSLERHRVLWLYLKQETDFFTAPLKVLHVAPELSFMKRFEKLKNLDYITADIESPLAKVKMDVHDIPFPENTFDVIFCNHVLEHVQDDLKVMSEFKRVLKPGGWALLQSPWYPDEMAVTDEDTSITDPKERERRFGQNDHVRKYGADYPERLSRSGLKVTGIDFVSTLPEEIQKKYALPITEIVFVGRKS